MQQEARKCQLKETIWWSISNFAQRTDERLFSEPFKSSFCNEVTWRLCAYPNGSREVDRGHVSLFLYNGPDRKNNVTVTYVFSVIGIDGSVLNENKSTKQWHYKDINPNNGSGFPRLFSRERIDEKLCHGALKIRVELTYEKFDDVMKTYSIMSCPKNFVSVITQNFSDDEDVFKSATAAVHRLNKFEELIDNQDADFVVELPEGRTIGLHKAILRMNWPYFSRMINSQMTESKSSRLVIVDHSYEAIKNMIIHIYSGAVRFTDINAALELFKAAHQYELEELAIKCENFALNKLDRNNLVNCLVVAVKYDLQRLKQAALELLIAEKRKKVLMNLSDIPNYDKLNTIDNHCVYVELSQKFYQEIS